MDHYSIEMPVIKFLFVLVILSFFLTAYVQPSLAEEDDEEFLEMVENKTFLFFYENTDERGFTIESTAWPIGSIASSGFYLTSIPIAIERKWITHEEGYQRVLTTLNSYYDDPNDPDDFYVENEHGFFPHWFHQETGKWNEIDCFSSIDTAILMAGVLTVRQYFPDTEIETVATNLYEDVDWEWMLNGGDTLSMGWRPDTGFLSSRWEGYNEGMLAVLLALGSPDHSIPDESWDAWTRTYKPAKYTYNNQSYTFIESSSTSLFTYQYPHIWFDFKGKSDKKGINYYQNSVNATFENRAYCIENPNDHKGYGPNVWGLTACECPLHEFNYEAHGPRQNDDGTVSPAGACGSMIFTPDESIEALRYMKNTYGDMEFLNGEIFWGKYGFKDAINLEINWSSPTYIGINQGAILTMTENYRSQLVQNLFMQNEYAKKAMQKAGFKKVIGIQLYTGWNLISLPLMPEDTSITSLLSSINGNYSIVWAYNASDTADHWKKYDPGAPFGNDLTTMEAGKGYWIMMTSNDTLFVTGDVPGSTDIILKAGWNLIGYNSLVGQPIENALASVSGNYSIIWAYDTSDTADHWKKYDPGAPFGNDLANMEVGKGYWIMMTTDDILEI